jgi:3-methyladenine DNA glycosylase/8-oxoguanine DNA glycosylase
VLALSTEALRETGLSASKVASIRDLAEKVSAKAVGLEDIDKLADDEIIDQLTTVRGIGRWTAEMFLIFQLRRLDVWPAGDYGVRKGYALSYRLAELPTPRQLDGLGDGFRPYRTVAAWYCWRAVDTVLPMTDSTR